jgi:hypothetical protein
LYFVEERVVPAAEREAAFNRMGGIFIISNLAIGIECPVEMKTI